MTRSDFRLNLLLLKGHGCVLFKERARPYSQRNALSLYLINERGKFGRFSSLKSAVFNSYTFSKVSVVIYPQVTFKEQLLFKKSE